MRFLVVQTLGNVELGGEGDRRPDGHFGALVGFDRLLAGGDEGHVHLRRTVGHHLNAQGSLLYG